MVDFKSIETFLWVVTLGSFRGAGQRLNTTQPAISQRIAQLEREMGVKLLNRDHRVVSPTASGRQLMTYAEKLIGLRAEMMAEVGDRSAMRGALRLGVAETIVHTWLPRLVKSVNTDYPNLSLEIEVDITPNLSARLFAQEIELAFVLGPLSGPSVRNRVLCDYPVSFVTSPSLGLGSGPFTLKELAKFPIITFARKTQPYETVRSLFNRPDLPPIRLHASASLATVIHMAIEGLGHRRHTRRDRGKRARRRQAVRAQNQLPDPTADLLRGLARLAGADRGRAGRRPCRQNRARQQCDCGGTNC